MIGKQLSRIIILSFILNFLHMAEVVWSGFPELAYAGVASNFSSIQNAVYFSTHVPMYLFFIVFFFSHMHNSGLKWSLFAYTWVFVSEGHHFMRTLMNMEYYPGAITSLLYLVLGYFYLRQLYTDTKRIC